MAHRAFTGKPRNEDARVAFIEANTPAGTRPNFERLARLPEAQVLGRKIPSRSYGDLALSLQLTYQRYLARIRKLKLSKPQDYSI